MTLPTGIYNARDFGVLQNGSTDDGPAINNMVALNPEGSRYYFDGSVVKIDTPIVIGKDGIYFLGKNGGSNPDNGGNTRFWANTAIDIITFDKVPGGTPTGVPSPANLINGGGLQGIILDGSNGIATTGLRVVEARNLIFRDLHVRGCQVGVDTLNHGTVPGAGDIWDHTTGCLFDQFEIITIDGIGLRLRDSTYSVSLRSGTVTCTNTGVGIDLYGVDDIWFYDVRCLTQNAAGTAVRMTGADYQVNGGTGKAPTGVHFFGGYTNGVGTNIRMIADDFDLVPQLFWHGMGTEDGEPKLVIDAGAQFYYTNQLGHHSLRFHSKYAADIREEFMGGSLVTGSIGELGWGFAASGTAAILYVPPTAGNHPGIRRIDTGATINSTGALYLPHDNTSGIFWPGDSFDGEFIFKMNNSDVNVLARVGFGMNPNANPPTDGIYIEKLDADTGWFAVTRAAGVQTRSPTQIVATAAGTWVRVRIRRQNNATIGFQIGDHINLADAKRLTTTIPAVALSPFFLIKNSAAVQKTMDVDFHGLHIRDLAR